MSTTIRARYFPAAVRLPDGRVLSRVSVILAEGGAHHGLHVYERPDVEVFHAPIDWARTGKPNTGRAARTGVDVHLADGTLAVITPGAGCKCGALGRWSGPVWATSVASSA